MLDYKEIKDPKIMEGIDNILSLSETGVKELGECLKRLDKDDKDNIIKSAEDYKSGLKRMYELRDRLLEDLDNE